MGGEWLRFGSLFAGIGGLDLGLERSGMECAWQVEWDEYCSSVLAKHWPDVPRFGDIHDVGASNLAPVDLIVGGFPCQPVSNAGKQKAQADERWLWPEFARVLRELRPKYALLENVPGLLTANQGRAAQEVFGDLAELGFDAEWASIPAASVGAPHLRYRVFIVAHCQANAPRSDTNGERSHRAAINEHREVELRDQQVSESRPLGEDVPDAQQQQLRIESGRGSGQDGEGTPLAGVDGATQLVADAVSGGWDGWPGYFAEAPRRGESADGGWWATEPDVGRVAHGVPNRVDRLRALGNAVVPQVAEWVGRQIIAKA